MHGANCNPKKLATVNSKLLGNYIDSIVVVGISRLLASSNHKESDLSNPRGRFVMGTIQ